MFVNLLPSLVPDFDAALYASLITLEVTCTAIIWLEWRSAELRWPVPALLAYYLLMHLTLTPLATSQGFSELQQLAGNRRTSRNLRWNSSPVLQECSRPAPPSRLAGFANPGAPFPLSPPVAPHPPIRISRNRTSDW